MLKEEARLKDPGKHRGKRRQGKKTYRSTGFIDTCIWEGRSANFRGGVEKGKGVQLEGGFTQASALISERKVLGEGVGSFG